MPLAREGPVASARSAPISASDLFGRHSTRTQDLRRVDAEVDDGALDADRAGSAVEDHVEVGIEPVAQVGEHVGGRRRADTAEPVRRRRGERVRCGRSARGVSGWAGTRSPTEARPPVISSSTRPERGSRTVSGPGHASATRVRAPAGTSLVQSSSAAASARWTISGCAAGRPLTSKIRRTAVGFVASAASP